MAINIIFNIELLTKIYEKVFSEHFTFFDKCAKMEAQPVLRIIIGISCSTKASLLAFQAQRSLCCCVQFYLYFCDELRCFKLSALITEGNIITKKPCATSSVFVKFCGGKINSIFCSFVKSLNV